MCMCVDSKANANWDLKKKLHLKAYWEKGFLRVTEKRK